MTYATRLGVAALCSLLSMPAALAADYPSHTVSMMLPFAPGGSADVMARLLSDQFQKKFGVGFIVINKPGAFGIPAMQEVVRQKPDGTTLMIGNVTTNALTPILYPSKMSFNYDNSIIPVTRLAELPAVLVATTVKIKPASLPELISLAKAQPGSLNYASAGIGSFPHFDGELFNRRAGIDAVHVPLKGGAADMVASLLSGETQYGFINVSSVLSLIKAGRLQALAVVSQKRLPQLPDVPTMAEAGFPNVGTIQWLGMFVRSGTPPEIVEALFNATAEALRTPAIEQNLERSGIEASLSTSPAEAAEWQRNELVRWKQIVEEANVKLE